MRAINGEFAQTFTRFCAALEAVPPARGCWGSGMDSNWLRALLGFGPTLIVLNRLPVASRTNYFYSRNETRLRNFLHLFKEADFPERVRATLPMGVPAPRIRLLFCMEASVCLCSRQLDVVTMAWDDVFQMCFPAQGPRSYGQQTSAHICEINFRAVPALM
jgi:hypothetical protein